MAKRTRGEDAPETDRLEGFAHPRETTRLVGQDAALERVSHAIRGGRPAQAWLITGPPGVGKATLAYRMARYLLTFGATDRGPADLSVPSADAVRVAAGSHPGLLVLRRGLNPDTGKLMNVLSVDVVRRLAGFFGMTSGAGGWRVAIVDSADDMNDNAANALLKMLEEPPSRAMVIVLSNLPGRLLPTIRSRVITVRAQALTDAEMKAFAADPVVAPLLDLGSKAGELIKAVAGAPGRLAERDAWAAAIDQATRFLEAAANPDRGRAARVALSQGTTGARGKFSETLDALTSLLHERARAAVSRGENQRAKGASQAIALVEETKELTTTNVNPQLLTAALLRDLAPLLR